MLLPIKPIIQSNRIRKDGSSVIYLQYCQDSERRILLNSGIAIPPKFWNAKKLIISEQLPPTLGNSEELNEKLIKLRRKAEDIILTAVRKKHTDPISLLNELFYLELDTSQIESKVEEQILRKRQGNPRVNLDVYFQIDDYIKSKSLNVTPGMLRIYRNMKEHLQAFVNFRKEPITFESFDLDFYESFINYLTYNYVQKRRKEKVYGLKVNTIGKTIKQLRIFLKNRIRKRITPPIDLDDYNVLEEDVDAIYLTWQEIRRIYNVDLSNSPQLIDHRNLFVLGCMTGLRFSDFSSINVGDVRNGMLHKKQRKSDRWVVIPLRKEALYLFENDFRRRIPRLSNVEFNENIKLLGKLAGINELITFSHKKGNRDIMVLSPSMIGSHLIHAGVHFVQMNS